MILGLLTVSFANVACQHAYQHVEGVSLSEQNVVLYLYGVALNGLAWALFSSDMDSSGFFHHYTGWTVAVIVSQSMAGYLIGALFKYIDAVAAIFADLAAMLITAVVSASFFDLQVNPLFCMGFVASCCSFWIYYGGESQMSDLRSIEISESEQLGLLAEDRQESDDDDDDDDDDDEEEEEVNKLRP